MHAPYVVPNPGSQHLYQQQYAVLILLPKCTAMRYMEATSSMFQVISHMEYRSDGQLFYLLYILPVGTWSWFLSNIFFYSILHATSNHPYEHDKFAHFTKKIT
jgi:hypothetical protein